MDLVSMLIYPDSYLYGFLFIQILIYPNSHQKYGFAKEILSSTGFDENRPHCTLQN